MSRKSVFGAISASNCALEAATRRIATRQQRTFTSTAQRNAAHITHFTPTSSPALDALLTEIRTKIILPSHLTQEQRKQLSRKRYEKKLQDDPIVIEIDNEVLRFRYTDPIRGGLPSTRKSVVSAIEQFQTEQDFANLRPLIQGIHNAGRKLPPSFYAKVLRVVASKGRVYDMIELARSVKHTGYKLDSSEKVNEMLHYVQMKAVDSKWKKTETEQALKWSQMVLDMLEEEEHQPKRTLDPELAKREIPLKRDPQVLMAPLHLAAGLVVKCGAGGEEAVEKVEKIARRVVAAWPAGTSLARLHPEEVYADPDKMGYLVHPSKFVALTAPLLHGLQLASRAVRDPELAKELSSRAESLAVDVEAARLTATTEGKGKRGEDVYKQFYADA